MNNNQTNKESINDTKTIKKNFAERIISAKDIQSFDDVINSYRQESSGNKSALGKKFEFLIRGFLQTEKTYKNSFKKIYTWNEFLYKKDFGDGHDVGIDLVGVNHADEYYAIQCKCYSPNRQIDKKSVDSFLSTSQKIFDQKVATPHEIKDGQINEGKRFAGRYFVSTTDNWTSSADAAIQNQSPPAIRINLNDLRNANVDWTKLQRDITGEDAIKNPPKELRDYQQEALDKAIEHFNTKGNDRGKLIMACGTGKTLTSLRIAETLSDKKEGIVLFLMPSLALLGQTIRAWNDDAKQNLYSIVVCSDPKTNEFSSDNEDSLITSPVDIGLPASTDPNKIAQQIILYKEKQKPRDGEQKEGGLIVVFSTYHSIAVSAKALEILSTHSNINSAFDLIICDEAHQTTGIRKKGDENTAFTFVHSNENIFAEKRMYMTATPRMYGESAKSHAKKTDMDIYSMDDKDKYGKEFYRLGFAKAVKLKQLSPYQVIALGYRPEDIPENLVKYVQEREGVLEGNKKEVNDLLESLGATIGCINAMSKRNLDRNSIFRFSSLNSLSPEELKDEKPMKKAVAFCKTINHSKTITNIFNNVSESFFKIDSHPESISNKTLNVYNKRVYAQAEHVDGKMNTLKRDELLHWLKSSQPTNPKEFKKSEKEKNLPESKIEILNKYKDVIQTRKKSVPKIVKPEIEQIEKNDFYNNTDNQVCKVLTNVRCLSEGVDVPALDAAFFISPKESQIQIVQAVGRVMRKSKNKNFGYIIIPVLMKSGDNYQDILDKNKRFKTVWKVLQALKSHDEDFNVVIEKMKLNQAYDTEVAGPGDGDDFDITDQLKKDIMKLSKEVKAVLVDGLTDRSYWTTWAKEAGMMARKQEEDIRKIIEQDIDKKQMFQEFLDGLKKSVSPNITEDQAREMLGQHMVTKPIFESLFEGYSFANKNAVSASMEVVVEYIQENLTEKTQDNPKLQRFYRSVKDRVSGIENPSAKQDLIKDIYDNFFKEAFPKVVQQLGIVYTPVEVVDFIIHSINDVLQKEFGRTISDKGVRILDPFTGTGTFITRLFQSGLKGQKDLHRKYTEELAAFEIVLMAYYVASVNIENAYHDATDDPDDGIGTGNFTPFEGIVLTDTFQTTENNEPLMSEIFPENCKRLEKQKKLPITVIMGNPPYSVGQKNENDKAANQKYHKLENRIKNTYVKNSLAKNKVALYDSYFKAFRWSTDRIDKKKEGGVIAFVTNGGWLDSDSGSGFRKCIEDEFSSIYVLNLRGGERKSKKGSEKRRAKYIPHHDWNNHCSIGQIS
ncbi:MAG: DEAD/DEAH box helicase family protein [Flavobacteriaceae bacterium]|nr:DEAD/DEAH box helicase family protein [Flavobacteriaceae bacterium]